VSKAPVSSNGRFWRKAAVAMEWAVAAITEAAVNYQVMNGAWLVVIISPSNLEQLKKPDDGSNERKAGRADVLFEAGLTRGRLAKAVLVSPVGHISRSPPLR
jgi:hypothetical protein